MAIKVKPLSSLDLDDKSGIINYVLNGDFQFSQNERNSITEAYDILKWKDGTDERFRSANLCLGTWIHWCKNGIKFKCTRTRFDTNSPIQGMVINPAYQLELKINQRNTADPVPWKTEFLTLQFDCRRVFRQIFNKPVTLSFWYKSDTLTSNDGNVVADLNIFHGNNQDGSKVSHPVLDNGWHTNPGRKQAINNKWTQYRQTYLVQNTNITESELNNSQIELEVYFPLVAGTTFYITAVQLESGNSDSQFSPVPESVALYDAQLFYQVFETEVLNNINSKISTLQPTINQTIDSASKKAWAEIYDDTIKEYVKDESVQVINITKDYITTASSVTPVLAETKINMMTKTDPAKSTTRSTLGVRV